MVTPANNGILFDMAAPEVTNEQAAQPESVIVPTANENLVLDTTPEITQSPITEPIQMDVPETKQPVVTVPSNEPMAATDPLDIFSAGIQNNEVNNNEGNQPKQAADDLGFLDAFV